MKRLVTEIEFEMRPNLPAEKSSISIIQHRNVAFDNLCLGNKMVPTEVRTAWLTTRYIPICSGTLPTQIGAHSKIF
jgi:hypothetical protein